MGATKQQQLEEADAEQALLDREQAELDEAELALEEREEAKRQAEFEDAAEEPEPGPELEAEAEAKERERRIHEDRQRHGFDPYARKPR
jgi:hypothetical protein